MKWDVNKIDLQTKFVPTRVEIILDTRGDAEVFLNMLVGAPPGEFSELRKRLAKEYKR